MTTFEINDVFVPTEPLENINGAFRIIETLNLEKVVIIEIDSQYNRGPKWLEYDDFVNLIHSEKIVNQIDPYWQLSFLSAHLPPAATERLKKVIAFTENFSQTEIFVKPKALRSAITAAATSLNLSRKTIERWLYAWLKSGRNCNAVVDKFMTRKSRLQHNDQTSGRKRGAKNPTLGSECEVSGAEVASKIKQTYECLIKTEKMTWRSAYDEMIITRFNIPPELILKENNEILLDPAIISKYRLPTWDQFRYRCRQEKKNTVTDGDELPRGKRGLASESVPGPGFFEIDATFFQIQLVSRITKGLLVGRPVVYLIVDLFDGIIAGYSVTLENPSWATAALALHNCFSPKQPIFERLGLPFSENDWPCHHLPNMLRADRAELISNMGHHFNRSGIRVEVTPSMTPIAKGTVEGKNAQIKHRKNGRFNLPGQYSKILKRRESDGKKQAALDIFEFEKILVEIIMELNRSPVRPKQIPPDAIPFGASVATRKGLHAWALEHRAGFTRLMPPNFAYEYLLTQATGTVTTLGIAFKGEVYISDRLREVGFLNRALDGSYKIAISYNPLFAAEIFFFDRDESKWCGAYNTDPEVYRIKASFSEAKEYRTLQKQLVNQAKLEGHIASKKRQTYIRKSIREAIKLRNFDKENSSKNAIDIIANRAEEKALHRAESMNGALNDNKEILVSAELHPTPEKNNVCNEGRDTLWEKVNAVSRS
ncbi:hypothetical protein [Pseudomonas moorei]|uniref:Integrase catalytic domain-containing protein n=1 Tax=Pseudomonas moorei TaxID=395599 RepID=A0A1H1I411_9PSED|nr:hypothetical protein [Pseudomonas moorei]SDR32423.1 hypothetical protein SAMN04490195_4860 [Pseudomonas moorei]